ncbi:DUF3168 domain-containing protein [Martelella mediterranea]|uniref:DUF3168 domain-containing protein n=1 Tax=Martelella mediterranea DSM 17316 TaxID=1122214 RepID=A0A1U9YYL2_9HYPH|nr:DUF3168 domain-containing protein [Martelella mediterranea]AQZ50529.1 hypothetical protein Mame_01159 [Martelella mediterranea DSM 17316]
MSADLALQKAIRDRLASSPAMTALVPAANILDRNARPAPDPSIVIGEGQSVDDGAIGRDRMRIYMDLHIWKREEGLEGAKLIAWSIRVMLANWRPALATGFHCVDCFYSGDRFLRDPGGNFSHGIVNIEALVEVTA